METSVDNGSENPTQIQTKDDTETFIDPNTTSKSFINFLKGFQELNRTKGQPANVFSSNISRKYVNMKLSRSSW